MFNFSKLNQKFDMIAIANYCLIAYAFLLPLSAKMASKMIYPIIICLILSGQFKKRLLFIIQNKIIQSFLYMLAIYTIWTLGSDHLDTAFFSITKLFKLLFVMLIIALSVHKKFIYCIFQGFLLAMFFSELVSFAMYFHSANFLVHYILIAREDNVPFMMNYTQHTTIMSIMVGFLFYQLLRNKTLPILSKIAYSFFMITSSLNLFILGSRIGYILFLSSIIIVLILSYHQNIKKFLLYAIFIVCIGYSIAYHFSPTFKDRITGAINDIQQLNHNNLTTSLGARLGFILYSIESIKEHLIFGLGTGDHVYEVRKNILAHEENPSNVEGMLVNIPDSHGSNLHNQFLDLLLQFGIIGLIVFLNIFYQIQKSHPNQNFLKPLPYLLVVNILIASFANPLFIYGDVERIFVLLVALLITPFEQIILTNQEQKKTHVI